MAKKVLASTAKFCPECGSKLDDEEDSQFPDLHRQLLELNFSSPSKLDNGEDDDAVLWVYGNTEQPLFLDMDTAEIVCSGNGRVAKCKQWFVNEELHSMVLDGDMTIEYKPISDSFISSMLGQTALKKGGIALFQKLLSLI